MQGSTDTISLLFEHMTDPKEMGRLRVVNQSSRQVKLTDKIMEEWAMKQASPLISLMEQRHLKDECSSAFRSLIKHPDSSSFINARGVRTQLTPLQHAVVNGDVSACMQLLERGADVNMATYMETALDMAIREDAQEVVEVLLTKAHKPEVILKSAMTTINKKNETLLEMLLRYGNLTVNDLNYLLAFGVMSLHAPTVQKLLDAGADVEEAEVTINGQHIYDYALDVLEQVEQMVFVMGLALDANEV